MPVAFQDRITRSMVREHSEWLFVFGGHLARRGLGGKARECQGEPNAVGVPTKQAPAMTKEAFFPDADLDLWLEKTAPIWWADRKSALIRSDSALSQKWSRNRLGAASGARQRSMRL